MKCNSYEVVMKRKTHQMRYYLVISARLTIVYVI